MNKMPLSVVIITKNEEQRLKECLESVDWASEIIVLDDFSKDKTLDIARQYTNKVFQKKMEIEGAHRNYAYSLANEGWVLSLDADERVSPELKNEIIKIITDGTICNGFTIPRRNYIGNTWIQHGGWYPSAQLKLFRKGEFKYEEVEVHPRAFMKDPRGEIKADIIHYTYRDISDFVKKLDKQTTMEAKKWIKEGGKRSFSRALRRTIDRFFRAYNKKHGKKDGMLGFILAIFGGFYQILSYAKYWEVAEPADYVIAPAAQSPKPKAQSKCALSVVIPTKNCETDIRNCLESVKWADEILIIDGFSTDKTLDICREYTNRIVQYKHKGDYYGVGEEERNIGIDNAKGDWILQLDSDEIVTAQFRKDAEKILKSDKEPCAAYKFKRKNYFLGHFMRFGGWYHYSLHFFKRGKARYRGNIHEELIVDGDIGKIESAVEHYPFKSIEQFIQRHNSYSDREARMILDKYGILDKKTIEYNIKKKPFKLFRKFYIKKKGFLEGKYGFIFSVLFAWVHFLNWAKYWELVQNRD
ncbi:MAG: glycosyltransferase family 2 protein [Candidatus Omnitrophota bacterium]